MTGAIGLSQSGDVRRSLLLGLGKSPLPGGDPLAVLALAAMRGKFARPEPPASAADELASYRPDANYLRDESRALLVRLLSGKDAKIDDGIALGALRAIGTSGLRMHPFDYARLEEFVLRHAVSLGPEERDWLRIVRPERKQDDHPYLDGPLTAETLPQASKAQKLQFLRALRVGDSSAARELIAKLIQLEPANIRADMVELLAVKLDDGDRQLLEGLAQDRAQSVREAAGALLGRIRGTVDFAKRIESLQDRLKIKTEGLLRRRKALHFTAPNASGQDPARSLLHGLRLTDVGEALGETPESLLAAAEASEKAGLVPFLLLLQAVKEGRIELAAQHRAILDGDAGPLIIELLRETLPDASGGARDAVLVLALHPAPTRLMTDPYAVEALGVCVSSPLPTSLARDMLEAMAEASGAANDRREQLTAAVAPLIPRSLSNAFLPMAEPFSRRAALYHQFLLSLPDPAT